jgi:hypothetical protein
VGSLLDKLIKIELDRDQPPSQRDRLARIASVIGPVASSGRGGKATAAAGAVTPAAPSLSGKMPPPAAVGTRTRGASKISTDRFIH